MDISLSIELTLWAKPSAAGSLSLNTPQASPEWFCCNPAFCVQCLYTLYNISMFAQM